LFERSEGSANEEIGKKADSGEFVHANQSPETNLLAYRGIFANLSQLSR
jgi:hypothetical protein